MGDLVGQKPCLGRGIFRKSRSIVLRTGQVPEFAQLVIVKGVEAVLVGSDQCVGRIRPIAGSARASSVGADVELRRLAPALLRRCRVGRI